MDKIILNLKNIDYICKCFTSFIPSGEWCLSLKQVVSNPVWSTKLNLENKKLLFIFV